MSIIQKKLYNFCCSENHLNIENCVENGSLYNKDLDCYNCPVCKKDVCKNQKSSIYFTYHMKKCAGETCTVTRLVPYPSVKNIGYGLPKRN